NLTAKFEERDEDVMEFFKILAVCHTAIIKESEEDEDENSEEEEEKLLEYSANSPDEEALTKAARAFGFEFVERKQGSVDIKVFGEREHWKILNILEFNSDRKRMSVIVRDPSSPGVVKLFCKGADNIIYSRLKKSDNNTKNS